MVSGLLSVDLVILLTWQFTDPLQRRLETFPLEKPLLATDDIRISPELEHCESENQSIWLGMYYIWIPIFKPYVRERLILPFPLQQSSVTLHEKS